MTDLFACLAASELAGGSSFIAGTELCAVPTRVYGPGFSYSLVLREGIQLHLYT